MIIEVEIAGVVSQFDADYWDHSANGIRLIKDGNLVALINNNASWNYLKLVSKYDKLSTKYDDEETTILPKIVE